MPRSVKTKEFIELTVLRGKGAENDPIREVTEIYERDGTFVADDDQYSNDHTLHGSDNNGTTDDS